MRRLCAQILGHAALLALGACTDDFAALVGPSDGGATEAAAPDSSLDATTDADAASLPAYACGDAGVLVGSCAECAGATIACPSSHSCVSTCSSVCAAGPIACVLCNGASVEASCAPDLSPSPSCPPSNCPCTATAATCPLDVEVCLGGACTTCGDVGTHDLVCRGGTGMMKCKDGTEPKVENRYTCR